MSSSARETRAAKRALVVETFSDAGKSQKTEDAAAEKEDAAVGLERYTLGKTLGEGGFASVRLATDATSGGQVAVKLMSKRRTGADEAQRERQVLYALGEHPHIVVLLDEFETVLDWALVLELVTGGEVFERVAYQGAFSEADGAAVVRQVARALQHLHSKSVVHRDLKPENLLLTSTEEVKVADFGLAAFYGPQNPPLHQSCGTINYVAPEMLLASLATPYGEAVDLWSVGAILFTLLGAYCAFDPCACLRTNEVEDRIINNEWDFERFPGQWTHVSDSAKDVIRGLLEPDVSKRFTAEQLLEQPWVVGTTCSKEALPSCHREKLQQYNEGRRTWRAAIDAAALFLGSPHMAIHTSSSAALHATASSTNVGASSASAPVVAHKLPDSAEDELRRAFQVYDKDGNGSIDSEELREVMRSLHVGGPGASVADVMARADTDGDGSISFDEFKTLVCPLYDASGAALRKIFSLFDEDGSGYIDSKELGVMLSKLGLGKDADTQEALSRVFATADLDGNGKVDFAEFTCLFSKANASTAPRQPVQQPASATTSSRCAVI